MFNAINSAQSVALHYLMVRVILNVVTVIVVYSYALF